MEDTSSTESPTSSLRDEGLLAFMRAFPLDILGKVVLSFLSICDEKRLWEEESAFRTVYTWCMAAHRESGLRRRKEGVWPLIRSTVAVFSQDGFLWTDKVDSFRGHRRWSRQMSPGGAVRGYWNMVKHGDIVLKHLCVTDAVKCDGRTLTAAARADSASTARTLVEERNVDPGAKTNQALRVAARFGSADVARLLLELPPELGVDPAADDNYALRFAARNGHTDVVKLLLDLPLERGVDPGADNHYALRYAAREGRTDIVKLLLDLPLGRGVTVGADADYAFRRAAENGHTDIVKLLVDLPLERGVDSGFYSAAFNGYADIVNLLVNLSPDRRPHRAVVQGVLSSSELESASISDILKEHLAETEHAPKRRKVVNP